MQNALRVHLSGAKGYLGLNVRASFTAFTGIAGSGGDAQAYHFASRGLDGETTVTAPTGFELSTDGDDWSDTLELAERFMGSLYVRLKANVAGDYSGDITHTCDGVSETVAVAGTVSDINYIQYDDGVAIHLDDDAVVALA